MRSDICKTTEEFSFIDSLFTIFERSFAIEQIRQYCLKNLGRKITVIDLGCYKGQLMSYLIQHRIFVNYIGIEIREDYLERSLIKNRKDVSLLNLNIAESIDLVKGDVVVSLEVLEHISKEKLTQVIKNVSNMLSNGGQFIVAGPINSVGKQFHSLERESLLGHINFFTKEDLISLCDKFSLRLKSYHSGYSLRSLYRIRDKGNTFYSETKKLLGSMVARALYLSLTDEDNGGGRFVFEKIE